MRIVGAEPGFDARQVRWPAEIGDDALDMAAGFAVEAGGERAQLFRIAADQHQIIATLGEAVGIDLANA